MEVNRKKMSEKTETITVSARIPKPLYEKLNKKLREDGFMNVSDLLRYLIRYYIQYSIPLIYTVEVSNK